MKKIIYIIAVLSFVSCKKENPVNYVVLSGNITNNTGDNIIISSSNYALRNTIHVAENGRFIDTLSIDNGTYLISYGRIFMRTYFEKGYPFSMNFDANDFKNTLSFSGKGAVANKYLTDKRKKEREDMGSHNAFYSLDEVAYKAKAMEIEQALQKLIDRNQETLASFKAKEKRNLNYEYISKLMGYERSHAYTIKNPDFKASEDFLPTLLEFNYSNGADYLFSAAYKRIVRARYKRDAKDREQSENLTEDIAYLKTVAEIPNDTIRNSLLIEDARYGITYTNNLKLYYKIFMDASTNEEQKSQITASYDILKSVAKGQPSPKFANYENNAGGTTSLEDLKGKYLYVDVWATWCGPCKKEIPFLKELEKAYHGKNIEFVSVSIDKQSDHGKWKKMIIDKELGGVQLLADNAWKSQFVQDYLIKGIPRFILIDPNGNIVTANAPGPSEEELIDLFKELNI